MKSTCMVSLLLLAAVVQGFVVQTQTSKTKTSSNTKLWAAQPGSKQPLYGKELDLPDTYVRCGKCQTIYALTEEDLGDRGKGW